MPEFSLSISSPAPRHGGFEAALILIYTVHEISIGIARHKANRHGPIHPAGNASFSLDLCLVPFIAPYHIPSIQFSTPVNSGDFDSAASPNYMTNVTLFLDTPSAKKSAYQSLERTSTSLS